MKSFLPLLLAFLALAINPLQAADDAATLKALQAADDARVAATIAGDQAHLTAIFSDELRYAHSSGTVDTKASYIESLTSGKLKYLSVDYQERNFTVPSPGIGLMTGRAHVKVGKADGTTEMVLAFLAVWREEKGQWHFLAWQSCKLTEPAK